MLKHCTKTWRQESNSIACKTKEIQAPKALLSYFQTLFTEEDSCLITLSTYFVVLEKTVKVLSLGMMLSVASDKRLMVSKVQAHN